MQSLPGTYALVLSSSFHQPIKIGKLGTIHAEPGYYLYVGSAFGTGGIKARVRHHRQKTNRSHWHIDYLRISMRLDEIWYTYDPSRLEHKWAQMLGQTKGASIPLSGFGSSDCRCKSHLYFFSEKSSGRSFRRNLFSKYKDHEKLYIEKP